MHRLVIFEGIMGSGKSTSTLALAAKLQEGGVAATAQTEKQFPHPLRATDQLDHWYEPWRDVNAEALARLAQERWIRFTGEVAQKDTVAVVDGQLFHGDLTNLFLMGAPEAEIEAHAVALADTLRKVPALLVYHFQADVDSALKRILALRGPEWQEYQFSWKLNSPLAPSCGYSDLDGFLKLYRRYRALTDKLYARLDLPKLAIDTSGEDWSAYQQQVLKAISRGSPQ